MNLWVAIPLGIGAAVAYGVAAAMQHDAVQQPGADGARTFGELARDPRWLMGAGGDTLGLLLQLAALATGPVVLIQPLFVLCLPVALPIRARFGGAPPGRRDYLACLLLAMGLGTFFALAGDPHAARELSWTTAGVVGVSALVLGIAVYVFTRGSAPTPKAVALSIVSGLWFGVEAVLVNGVSSAYSHSQWDAFTRATGLVPLVGALVIGTSGFALSQLAFQAGSLGASFPAMLVVDPLVAVLLGAVLLGENVHSGPFVLLGYALSAVLIVYATFALAADRPVSRSEAVAA